MKITGEIELSGIKRIVINRISVWERKGDPGEHIWWKISGGPGLSEVLTTARTKNPAAMMAHVNKLLSMGTIIQTTQATKKGTIDVVVVQVLAYRCWVHGDTLNIVRKDLP